MNSPAHQSDQTLREAGQSLVRNRDYGGRRLQPIGRRSGQLRRQHWLNKLIRIGLAVMAVYVAAGVAGWILSGIGFFGVMLTLLATVIAIGVFARYPRFTLPEQRDLSGADIKSLVGRTELWLEGQRPALPPPAVQLVDQIGGQLDALGLQLDGLDENTPAAREVRKLVGEHLPELVSSYTAIPRHLRGEERGGTTPDAQLVESLGKIGTEIDSVTRQLAAGAIDNLAIRTRYLDYKYGDALDEADKN